MKVVALLSGGKDSCYTILKVTAHGHDVVALAHIVPPVAEADSFMYQSVGSAAVPHIADALGLPLFTRTTNACAVRTTLAYAPQKGDEVEDLVALLNDVKMKIPDVQAVCAGALWSDYQRLRVENAASRAALLSLAPLWRRNQGELLDEMIQAGVEAVLVKVAGVGLDESHLGKTLSEMRPTLLKMNKQYGSHVCGEGGEYETLVLYMPMFKKRLVLDDARTVMHEESSVAPVAYLDVRWVHLEDTPMSSIPVDLTPLEAPVPREVQPLTGAEKEKEVFLPKKASTLSKAAASSPHTQCVTAGDYAHVVCLSGLDGAAGVSECTRGMQERLEVEGYTLGDILYVWLNLGTVSGTSYTEANKAYTSVFGVPECVPPPSRACIAMPNGAYPVSIEALARRGRRSDPNADARTLHVQSLSEWAPPCIGPYAQVVEDNGVTLVSGAIAMHAPTASIAPSAGARAQTRACLHNLRRTLEATRTSFESLTMFVAYAPCASFFDSVHEEFAEIIGGNPILAVVPCTGLPKDALVEIRASGSYNGVTSSYRGDFASFRASCKSPGAHTYAVRNGALAFAKVFLNSDDSALNAARAFVGELAALEERYGHLVVSQVYIAADQNELEKELRAVRGDTLNVILCDAVPGGARVLGVVTLRCAAG